MLFCLYRLAVWTWSARLVPPSRISAVWRSQVHGRQYLILWSQIKSMAFSYFLFWNTHVYSFIDCNWLFLWSLQDPSSPRPFTPSPTFSGPHRKETSPPLFTRTHLLLSWTHAPSNRWDRQPRWFDSSAPHLREMLLGGNTLNPEFSLVNKACCFLLLFVFIQPSIHSQCTPRKVDLSGCGLHPASLQQLQQPASLGKTALTHINLNNYSYTWKNWRELESAVFLLS